MKICAVQGMIALTLCGVSIAHPHYAQVLERTVTLDISEASFEDALHEIEAAAQVRFAYSPDQLSDEQPVTLHSDHNTLQEVLDALLVPREITYTVHEREAAITLKKINDGADHHQSLLRASPTKAPPPVPISGTITDATSGQPMAGVNVIIKGTTNGTTTDAAGQYHIEANTGDIIVFSFIGFSSQEIQVGTQSVIDVVMEEDIQGLNEVVVNAGYYTTTKSTQTGNIVRVDAEDIEKQPVSNPLAALQARVPGLEVVQQTGVPGGNFKVRIRGQNSIGNGNDPLYIIDGVPYTSTSQTSAATSNDVFPNGFGTSPLNYINPYDIESIEVLKDADATAVYGSRGANGVILITTKKGKKGGKTTIDLNYAEGVGQVSRKMDLLNTSQYLSMRNQAFANDTLTPTAANAPDLLLWDAGRNTDWQKKLIGGTSRYRDAQLSLSGNEKNTFISAGLGYHHETTVFPGDNNNQRLSSHLTARNTTPNGRLTTTVTVNYAFNSSDFINRDLTREALMLAPNAPALYDANGNLSWGLGSWTNSNPNPLAYTKKAYESKTNTLVGNLSLNYVLTPHVDLKFSGGGTSIVNRSLTLDPSSSYDPAVAGLTPNSSAFSSNFFTNWIAEPQVNTHFDLGEGKLVALVGASFLNQLSEGTSQYAQGFASESLMRNISAADQITQSSGLNNLYRYDAIFGRVNYSLKDKYFLNLTARRDGSSRFGPGKKFSNFGAVGVAWVFSREAFGPEFLSLGKIRASYGVSGNDQIGDYQYLDTYSNNGSGLYDGVRGLSPQRLFNPNFAWEKIRKAEVGLDWGMFENRITGTFSYFSNRSSNQLLSNTLPPTTGFGSIQSNLPALVQNAGLEIELNSVNIKTPEFTFSTSFNITLPRNKLVSFPNLENSTYAYRLEVGQPLNVLKVYHYTGLDPATGAYAFKDENNDGVINGQDRQTARSYVPQYYGGLSNSFGYKNFQLEFRFQFVKQTGYNYLSYFTSAPGQPLNQPAWIVNEEGTADFQRYSTSSVYQNAYNNLQVSDRSFSDASFIRLKNLSFSYSLNAQALKKMKLDGLRFFIQAQNVLTFTNYRGLDPETQSNSLPPLRVFTAGIHATF